jgi:hypothetical protein
MGMYTELFLQVRLKGETPVEILDTIKFMLGTSDIEVLQPFEADRWSHMLQSSSFYHYPYAHSSLDGKPYDGFSGNFLFVRCDFKNYTGELKGFLNWIAPYVEEEGLHYQGHWRYEEYDLPTRITFHKGTVSF